MRQLVVHVPRGQGGKVLDMARDLDGRNMALLESRDGGDQDLVLLHVSNGKVEDMLDRLGNMDQASVTLNPHPILPINLATKKVADQVHDVELRSPVEVVLGSMRSIGSWKGFLGYAAASGAVTWIGLTTNAWYLLTAGMLIAPFAQPAMNGAIATAIGDGRMFLHSLGRYFASLATSILLAWLLSLAIGPQTPTQLMSQIASVSMVAFVLPVVAGAAGAINLLQTEGDNLVSGAGVGLLVAASLAPPATLVGMGAALGQWSFAATGLFQLLLQLTGINVAGSLVFALFGVRPHSSRFTQGRRGMLGLLLAVMAMAFAGLLFLQVHTDPTFQGGSKAQTALNVMDQSMRERGDALLVDSQARFLQTGLGKDPAVLAHAWVMPKIGNLNGEDREALRREISYYLRERLNSRVSGAPVLLTVTIVDRPPKAAP